MGRMARALEFFVTAFQSYSTLVSSYLEANSEAIEMDEEDEGDDQVD